MLRWTSVLLLVGPIVLLWIAFRRGRDERSAASPRTILLIYLVSAAAPLLFALLWRLDATRIVIELHGIAFRGNGTDAVRRVVRERRQGSGRIVIGDVAGRRRNPAERRFGTLLFQPNPSRGGAKGTVIIQLPPPADRAGVISTEATGLLGAQTLEDGDRLCVEGTCWVYDEDEATFTSGKHVARIPPRAAEIPGLDWTFTLPLAGPIPASNRTWSIDWLAHDSGALPADRRLRSFLCYSKPGSRLRLVPMDRNVVLQRGGRTVASDQAFPAADGKRIAFYTLPSESSEFAAAGIAERRSMVVRAGERSFVLDLDTPEIHSVTVGELRALQLAREKGTPAMNVALSMGDAQLVDRSLYFSGLSESVAVEANALFQLSPLFPRNLGRQYPVVSPRGPVTGALGSVHWLGASDLAAIRFDVLRPPLLLLIAGAVLLLLKAASAFAARFTVTQMLIAGALELLVGLRLLLGYRVWSMPPHRIEAAELATVAWMALPWMFLAASIPVAAFRTTALRQPALAGLLLSAMFTLRVADGRTRWIWFGCHFLALGVALVRADEVQAWLRKRWIWLVEKARPLTQRAKRADPIVVVALLFTFVRLLLLLGGFKESIALGPRVSLSVLHIPAAAFLQGYFLWRTWQRVRTNGQLTRSDHVAALSIFFFVWCIPAALTSDIGLALLNVPLFALLYLGVARHASSEKGRRLPRVLAFLVALFIAGAPLGRLVLPFVSNEEFLLGLASDSNYARFLHFAAPERLRELATKRGESLAITSAILQSYISSGLVGRGYGHSDVSPHLGDTALRDFAPAVFVAAEWGLVGSVAVLLTYLLFAIAARPWLPWNGGAAETRAGPAIAFVAAATITVSSCYMILANQELLLLTGKNAYLLGLDSAGDVIEVMVLVLIIAWGAAVARGEDQRALGGSA